MAHTQTLILCARFANKRPLVVSSSSFFAFATFEYMRVFVLWLRKLHFLFWSIDNNAIVIVDVRAISFRTMLKCMNERMNRRAKKLMSSEQKHRNQLEMKCRKTKQRQTHTLNKVMKMRTNNVNIFGALLTSIQADISECNSQRILIWCTTY